MNNNGLACDLMQDTFQKVFTNQQKLEHINNYKAWIFQIARNTLIDYTRKKKEKTVGDLVVVDEREELTEGTSEIEDISQCLYELIEEYNPEEQELLLDVFTKTLSQKEAAQAVDIPYSTFKSRVQKARKEIVDEFERRCCQLKYNNRGEIIGCISV